LNLGSRLQSLPGAFASRYCAEDWQADALGSLGRSTFVGVLLQGPPSRIRPSGVAMQHERWERANRNPVVHRYRLEERHLRLRRRRLVGCPTVPSRPRVRLLCRSTHLTYPEGEQSLCRLAGDSPDPRQRPFGPGQQALSVGLWIPRAFRRTAFASWVFYVPAAELGLPSEDCRAYWPKPDRNGVTAFHIEEKRRGRVPPVLRGQGVRPTPYQGG
jgi:hypothetical protein